MERRTHFDLCAEIIELCKYPGAPVSHLARSSGIRVPKAHGFLRSLIEGELIRTELRETSPHGLNRRTKYYITTPDGEKVLRDFTDVRARLSRPGAQPRSGSTRRTD
jgi:predicted transcriptional regulator